MQTGQQKFNPTSRTQRSEDLAPTLQELHTRADGKYQKVLLEKLSTLWERAPSSKTLQPALARAILEEQQKLLKRALSKSEESGGAFKHILQHVVHRLVKLPQRFSGLALRLQHGL